MSKLEEGLLRYLTEEQLKKIQQVKIGIAGAGGLGSNCAWNLVRTGFRNFKIVDYDKIEPSNLNRQFYFEHQVGQPKVSALKDNLLEINPKLNVEAIELKIDDENIGELFGDCDIVVEAFDDAKAKSMLVQAYLKKAPLLVAASGLAGWGKADEIITRKVKDNFYIIGDLVSEVSPDRPPVSPRVNITAAKQADVVLEWVLSRVVD